MTKNRPSQFLSTISCIATLLFLNGCATVRVPARDISESDANRAWALVLNKYVDTKGQVDFSGLDQDRTALESYVSFVAQVSPKNRPDLFATQADRMAYYLNSYNALSMYNVLDSGIPKTNSGLRKVYFFAFKKFEIGGQKMSLKTYEDDIIRKQNEPRVHFALNCMAKSCPRLPQVPFDAKNIDQQLQAASIEFFKNPDNFQLDSNEKSVTTSEILKFFPEDFVLPGKSLVDFINQYAPVQVPQSYTVKYRAYNWDIINSKL